MRSPSTTRCIRFDERLQNGGDWCHWIHKRRENITDQSSLCGENRLFATLDTTLHQAVLPSRHKILLADTIGFISNLPLKLFASFTATLQHVERADLLVHVMDLSHPDILAQRDQVMGTLKGLNIRRELMDGIITVGNKLDKCGPERVKWLKRRALLPPDEDDVDSAEPTTLSSYPSPPSVFPLPISCRTLDGLSSLIWKMDFSIRSIIGSRVRRFRLAPESSAIPYLYSSGLVPVEGPKTSECGQFLIFDIAMTDAQFARFKTVLGAKIKF
uniref:G domain-containing protein n=1 Tax=Globodera rostochiensis TaxID=31243 RepID=A0A914I8H5_GLORO